MWPSASTRPVVLIGDPVSHSLSPEIHNTAFRELGLDLVYLACRVPPAGLEDALEGLLALGVAGVNVTLPHKPAAARLASRLDDHAAATGVVNTLVPEGGGWLGANTDVGGFLAPLRTLTGLEQREALVLGAGGAARSVAYALLTALPFERLTIAARDADKAARLATELTALDPRGSLATTDLASAASAVSRATLVVNATSVGMTPTIRESPWPQATDFGPHHVVYDLIYAPAPSRLLRDAALRGARTIDGREMLLHQAAGSFRLWTGRDMPMTIARGALDRALEAEGVTGSA